MPHEQTRRASSFRPGRAIRLADGQDWVLPAPPDAPDRGDEAAALGDDYEAVVMAVAEAQDESERRLAELCLAIHLLGRNYRLGAADYQSLLEYPSGDPRLGPLQSALRDVAAAHVRSLHPPREAPSRSAAHHRAVTVAPSVAQR